MINHQGPGSKGFFLLLVKELEACKVLTYISQMLDFSLTKQMD